MPRRCRTVKAVRDKQLQPNCLDSLGCFPMIDAFVPVTGLGKERRMLAGGGIIKTAMKKRGFKHRRTEDQFTVRGEYARNLQFVYSKEYNTKGGLVVDLAYFCVDVLAEKLVIGLYRENPTIENGVYINASRALDLQKFSSEHVNQELDKLITPVRDQL
jgi:hypothetical protein